MYFESWSEEAQYTLVEAISLFNAQRDLTKSGIFQNVPGFGATCTTLLNDIVPSAVLWILTGYEKNIGVEGQWIPQEKWHELSQKLFSELTHKNPYELRRTTILRHHEERYQRIRNLVRSHLWEERILDVIMENGEIPWLPWAEPMTEANQEADREIYGPELAQELDKNHREFIALKNHSRFESFLLALDQKGLEVDSTTEHLIGGEYAGQCVGNWSNCLVQRYGIDPVQILINVQGISLLPPNVDPTIFPYREIRWSEVYKPRHA